ncbi:MAG: RNA polymerase sigma factor [Acidobacteria bacterium]|nr:RNA polymerase sigma factor [Acidobacteriota bacterium]MBI3656223.1 RNA polymerase sigma factor [Acidobacteriota bacterium]
MTGQVLHGWWLTFLLKGPGESEGTEPDPDPDTNLMLRFTQGDQQAFDILFNKYTRTIINYAFKFVGDLGAAEDLAQEIFLKVYSGKNTYRAEAKFKTWLYKIATNACISELRKPRYRQTLQSIDAPVHRSESGESARRLEIADTEQNHPLKQLELKEMRKALKAAVDGLPENQRLAFILTKYQTLSYQEVAVVLNSSEPAVKSLIHRAKETLIAKLKPTSLNR